MNCIDCTQASGLFADALGGELRSANRADLDAHLAACPACRAEHAALADAQHAVARAAGSAPDAAAATSGLAVPALATTHRAGHRFSLPTALAFAASLVLAFAAGYFVRTPSSAASGAGPSHHEIVHSPPPSVADSYARLSASEPALSTLGRGMLSIARR